MPSFKAYRGEDEVLVSYDWQAEEAPDLFGPAPYPGVDAMATITSVCIGGDGKDILDNLEQWELEALEEQAFDYQRQQEEYEWQKRNGEI